MMVKSVHILIVEDSIDLGRELKDALRDLSEDLSINAAPSAEEGILEMGRHPIDLLVTDFRLPGISGLELVRRIRRKYPQVKVILTSAVLDSQFMKEAEDIQVTQYLQKPVDVAEFRKTVGLCLGIEAAALPDPVKKPQAFVTKPQSELKKESDEDQLSKALLQLHQALKAKCTLWLDIEGEIEKAFGDLPIDLPRDVIKNATRAAAEANRDLANLLLASRKGSVNFQPGMGSDLIMASAAQGMLVAVFSPGIDPEMIGKKIDSLLAGIREIELPGGGSSPQTGKNIKTSTASNSKPAGDQDFENLIGPSGIVTSSEADDFWNNAGAAAKPELGNPDLLTYEQAKKMGLKIKKEEPGS
jgi:DNA-binding response OmpR family regulator